MNTTARAPDAEMRINADFTRRAAVHCDRIDWIASRMKGVERKMLDRLYAETGRATSVVRYAPGSSFSEHVHGGGEEFLVLEGVFQDQYGDFPAGTYVRNPPTTRHAPKSDGGCTILVKLHQFDPADRNQFHIQTLDRTAEPVPGDPARAQIPLYEDAREHVRIEQWQADTEITLPNDGGIELFVLEGAVTESGETFTPQSWLRLPPRAGSEHFRTGPDGARLWIKSRHLAGIAGST